MRIPRDAPQPPSTTTTTLRTGYSDQTSLLAEIPQIGDPSLHSPSVNTYPTTRDHPPFFLPIPIPLIDLFQLGDDNTRTAQQEALFTIHQLLESDQVTTDQIDKAAKLVVEAIDGYHLLAKKNMAYGSATHNTSQHQATSSHYEIRHKTTKTHHATQKHGQTYAPQPEDQQTTHNRPPTH
jgi:hypothetical protein